MEEGTNTIRTLIGTLGLIGGCLLYWICAYKLISCLNKKDKTRQITQVEQIPL